jgi:hypothetical protein
LKFKKYSAIVLAGLLAVLVSGCASATFVANQEKSNQIVKKLRQNFHLSGFTPAEVVEGEYNFETGGTPNASFIATADSNMNNVVACSRGQRYATRLSSTELTFFPYSDLLPKDALVACIASMKGIFSQAFRWNGKLRGGEKFRVDLMRTNNLSLTVSTNFPASEFDVEGDDGSGYMPGDTTLTKYIDDFQVYRNHHGIRLYTLKTLAGAKLVSKSKNVKITPVVSKDGFIRRLHVQFFDNNTYDQCFSAMPWSSKQWGISDPGPSYSTFAVESNKDLTTFGSQTVDSDCQKMPLHPIN